MHTKNRSESSRMLAFFIDFEENQLLDTDGCNWELPALLLINELGFWIEKEEIETKINMNVHIQ